MFHKPIPPREPMIWTTSRTRINTTQATKLDKFFYNRQQAEGFKLTDLLSDAINVPESDIETFTVLTATTGEEQISSELDYSRWAFKLPSKNGVYYRSKNFLGFDRFMIRDAILAEKPDITWKGFLEAFHSKVGIGTIARQIGVMTIETLKNPDRFLQPEYNFKSLPYKEMSLFYQRLNIHSLWVGHERERRLEETLKTIFKERAYDLTVRHATREEDYQQLFDLLIFQKSTEQPILGVSVKGPRYFKKAFSTHLQSGANRETAGHETSYRKTGAATIEVASDHHASDDDYIVSFENEILPSLSNAYYQITGEEL